MPSKLVSRPRSRESEQHTTPDLLPLDSDLFSPLTPRNNDDEGEQNDVIIKPVSSRSRLIGPATFETIPEEDETALEDSLVVSGPPRDEEARLREGGRHHDDDGSEEVSKTEEIERREQPETADDQTHVTVKQKD